MNINNKSIIYNIPDYTQILNGNNFFFFETNRADPENHLSYYFFNPVKILSLNDPEDLVAFFDELSELSKKYFIAGFFSYELGYLFEKSLIDILERSGEIQSEKFPFAFFCAYENPFIIDHNTVNNFVISNYSNLKKDYQIAKLKLNIPEYEYKNNIEKIRDHIRKGNIYQANYTIKYDFDFTGSPISLYSDLMRKQNAAYNVFAKFDDYYILSLSPELFFKKADGKIFVKPMKGTVKRGRNIAEDEKYASFLANDEKNRSENLMIVDLLRNDLGKISEAGSVRVVKLFEVEKYTTLFQMTTTIESIPVRDLTIYDLIKSIFPSGSITGAPKIRSMQIIRDLEKEERKIYTGSIGFFEPSGNSVFNVAIRTVLLHGNKGEMGIGGGIVYDSTPDDELEECKLKAHFLTQKPVEEFSLIETMLYDHEFKNINSHIERMRDSADYFGFIFSREKLLDNLSNLEKQIKLKQDNKYRVRVLLNRRGEFTLEHSLMEDLNRNYRITLSENRTDSSNIFLFHKTTMREMYKNELSRIRKDCFFDCVFANEKDEITEGAITNIYVKLNGEIFTPPLDSGLLNGTIRAELLAKGTVRVRIITLNEFLNCEAYYISNAIIGFREAALEYKNLS